MSWLTKIALKKRWVTFLVVGLLTIASIWATVTLKREMIPDIELPMTTVLCIYPQASAEEIMNQVTVPIEGTISDIEGLKHIISTSSEGMSMTIAEFEFGTDMERVNEIISQNLSELEFPEEVRQLPSKMPEIETNPTIYPININTMPVVTLSLVGDLPPDKLREIAVTDIMPRLGTIEGVFNVGVEGGDKDAVTIDLNPGKMNEFGISTAQVAGILAANQFNSLSEVENAPLGADAVVLSDIAGIEFGPRTVISRTDGNPSVSILVMKGADANTVEVATAINDEVAKINETLGDDAELITVMDQSQFINDSINELAREAITGAILAIIVVFLFLMVFRASLITAVSIPLSVLLGFLAMRAWGITINILTLSAMTIAVGRVIDDSIVMLEVIFRHLKEGDDFKEAAMKGAREIAAPVTSATIATIVIFIPLAFVGGIVGELFVPFALTVTFAMIASLLVALTVVPALSKLLTSSIKVPAIEEEKRKLKGDAWYQRGYNSALRWSLGHRTAIIGISAALFVGSLALLPVIGTSFIPPMGEKMLTVNIEMPPGSSLKDTQEIAMQVEEILNENDQVLRYSITAGASTSLVGGLTTLMGGDGNTAIIMAFLDDDADLEMEADELRRACQEIAGESTFTVSTGEAMMLEMTSGLDIFIRGEKHDDITDVTNQLLADFEDIEGITNIEVTFASIEPKLNIEPDMGKLMTSGLPMQQLQQLEKEFLLMMQGGTVAQVNIEGESYDIFLEGVVSNLDSVETAKNLRVGWPKSVVLGDIAAVELVNQPTSIQRIDQKMAANVTGIITARDVGAVNRAIQEKIDALTLPPGVEITPGGVTEEMGDTFHDMEIAIIIAIVLTLVVMIVTFRSVRNSFIIIVSLPMASIGAFLALLITGNTLSASGLMGILMLVGIVLTNAIVLISVVEQLRKEGKSVQDALIEGGHTRLRPILMTAVTTMIAMVPLAIGLGEGIVMASELAIVVLGGLFSSTFLTLLVIPAIYSLVYDRRR